jgi:hypothetical protein
MGKHGKTVACPSVNIMDVQCCATLGSANVIINEDLKNSSIFERLITNSSRQIISCVMEE